MILKKKLLKTKEIQEKIKMNKNCIMNKIKKAIKIN